MSTSKNKTGEKRNQFNQSKNEVSLKTAGSFDLQTALTELASLGPILTKAVGDVHGKLSEKSNLLSNLDSAIALKQIQLEELHGKDSVLLSIDDLNTHLSIKREETAKTIERLEFEYETAAQDINTRRSREEAQFSYENNQRHQKEEDAWNEEVRAKKLAEKIRAEEVHRIIAVRLAEVASMEADYKLALEKLATFDEVVRKEAATKAAIETSAIKKEYEHARQLADIKHSSELKELQSENKRLQDQATQSEALIQALHAQLKASQESQVQLAKEAVAAAAAKQQAADLQSMFTNTGGNGAARQRS